MNKKRVILIGIAEQHFAGGSGEEAGKPCFSALVSYSIKTIHIHIFWSSLLYN